MSLWVGTEFYDINIIMCRICETTGTCSKIFHASMCNNNVNNFTCLIPIY